MGAGNSFLKSNKTEKKEQLVSSKFKGSFGCGLSDNKFFFLFPKHYNFFSTKYNNVIFSVGILSLFMKEKPAYVGVFRHVAVDWRWEMYLSKIENIFVQMEKCICLYVLCKKSRLMLAFSGLLLLTDVACFGKML